nr:IS66 family insertion sequence element accessory protein TnpB [Bradyrhizobium oropedii]
MRRGMNSLGLLVQEAFKRDPHGGDLYVFRGKSGKLIKILWHDGLGMSLYAKRLERGRFLWPSPVDGVVTITPAQLGYLLEGSTHPASTPGSRAGLPRRLRQQPPWTVGSPSNSTGAGRRLC